MEKRWISTALGITICFAAFAAFAGDDAPDRRMAITIDDLPGLGEDPQRIEVMTRALLEQLDSLEAPAVAFVNEGRVEVQGQRQTRVRLLEMWLEAGHELGNHTYSHLDPNRAPLEDYLANILRGEEITRPLLRARGDTLRWFRHPYLHMGPDSASQARITAFLREHGYRTAPVTHDNSEWIYAKLYRDAKAAGNRTLMDSVAAAYLVHMDEVAAHFERVSRDLLGYEVPQVLLLHARELHADRLNELVTLLRKRGYRFVPLDEVLEDPAYGRAVGVHRRGLSWLLRWWLEQRGEPVPWEPDPQPWIMERYRGGS